MNQSTNLMLAVEAELYIPSMNNTGNYIDNIPSGNNGIRCSCTNRSYNTRSKFQTHISTQKHVKWLEMLNSNRLNYYSESIKQRELIDNQKCIIQKQSNKLESQNSRLNIQSAHIDYLMSQLYKEEETDIDLLDL